jgi:foldase protein PrsA
MMNYRFATLACASLGVAASLLMTACSADDKTIVSANGYKITKGQLDAKLESMPISKEVLHNMAQQALVFQYAKDNKIDVTEAQIDAKIAEIKQRLSDQQLADALKQQGMTQQDLRDLMKEQIIVKAAVDKGITVSDAQMNAYLSKNHSLLDQPAQVRARHILVKDLATAQMIEAKLKAGGDFAALAKQYSSDPGTKDKGGELGFFTQGAMVKEFSDVAFKMNPGQTSQPVHSPYGFHIIQVEEKKPAQVASLANSRQKIRDQMLSSQEQMLVPQFMDQLLKSAKIQIEDPRFSDLFPSPAPATIPTAAPAATPTK